MSAAIAQVHGKLEPEEIERLKFSSVAIAMGRYFAEAPMETDESMEHKKISQAKAKRMRTTSTFATISLKLCDSFLLIRAFFANSSLIFCGTLRRCAATAMLSMTRCCSTCRR
ncbi:hypothetical protein [Undibacterium sp. YM2]|uniref:hypothetical protein n=1 Tax=Undibacterium sp. YM2 TaxID=2058625 RepID=UPI00138A67BE|nr:hypothetical protein [Undibacterium sp. YM2]